MAEDGLDGDIGEVLTELLTVGFGVCAFPDFPPGRHSFLALWSQSSISLLLFHDEQ